MQSEFTAAWDRLKDKHTNAEGETYEKETTETAAEFMDLIAALMAMEGVKVELCGSWLWLTGNTYTYKEAIKALGFRWSKNKGAWYYHSGEYRKHSKKALSLDEIRLRFGSETVHGEARRGLDDTAAC